VDWARLVGLSAIAVVPAVGICLYLFVLRGRRHRHADLVTSAVAGMCTQLAEGPTSLRRLHRDLVDVLVGLDTRAQKIERIVLPLLTAPGTGTAGVVAEGIAAADRSHPVADLDQLLRGASDGSPAPDTDGLGYVDERDDDPEDDAGSSPVGDGPVPPVPRLLDAAVLRELHESMCRTVATQVRQARAILHHAAALGEPGESCRDGLVAALTQASLAEQTSRATGATDLLVALLVLTRPDVPISDDGVPGEAVRRELWAQAYGLWRVALRQQADLAEWCAAALCRRAAVSASTVEPAA